MSRSLSHSPAAAVPVAGARIAAAPAQAPTAPGADLPELRATGWRPTLPQRRG
ncbi:hypothetical protein GCM10010172_79080 [Paractinoplanes ferrugineus]|uniref:Uncharacterized protein n=1 Tax=Paractinoplanes ferrugineus TaxID=113564 RepID=A0A919J423_9ACTN|nr:hypothetical protein [Actinoplanes ferrugineus]GIE12982.1 hypothetical protein Afe05nite_48220 [Actinoplanes ferrugineus]